MPGPPTPIFAENFENGFTAGDTSTRTIVTYTGAPPLSMTYDSSLAWKNIAQCNGIVLSPFADDTAAPFSGCGNAGVRAGLENFARHLGFFTSGVPALTDPADPVNAQNHALAAYTQGNPNQSPLNCDAAANYNAANRTLTTVPPACNIEYETLSPIPLPAGLRFLSASIDVAVEGCQAQDPLYSFFLVDGANEIAINPTTINPCTGTPNEAPNPNGSGFFNVIPIAPRAGRYIAPTAIPFTGAAVGLRLRNVQPSGAGNDAAVDNLRLVDVSPQLDKVFSRSQVTVGDTVRIAFTVTNTNELAAKPGWSFTDSLPAGMTVAASPNPTTDCANGVVNAAGGQIAVSGDLTVGQTHCTTEVDVIINRSGQLTNGAANVSAAGLDPPAVASVAANGVPIRLAKRVSRSRIEPGEKTTFRLTVTNPSAVALTNVLVCDDLPRGLVFVRGKPKPRLRNGSHCWTIASIPAGAQVTRTLKARALGGACGRLTNKSEATAPTR